MKKSRNGTFKVEGSEACPGCGSDYLRVVGRYAVWSLRMARDRVGYVSVGDVIGCGQCDREFSPEEMSKATKAAESR